MKKLQITPVNETNWRDVYALTVAPSQTDFIETNAQSLLEAAFDTSLAWSPLALSIDTQVVGFAMIGAYDEMQQTAWLDRFMIDAQYQGCGYGGQFMRQLLTYIQETYNVTTIYLSAHDENTEIFAYYQRFGFIDTKTYDPANGERIMSYTTK